MLKFSFQAEWVKDCGLKPKCNDVKIKNQKTIINNKQKWTEHKQKIIKEIGINSQAKNKTM